LTRSPVAIATWQFGVPALEAANAVLHEGGSALDAVEQGILVVELEPTQHSVGYGGRPNSAGEVELDAAIMDGRTHRVGSVAALRGYRRSISVARRVFEVCRHPFLAGEGAAEFARAQGFVSEPTLTEETTRAYEEWLAEKRGAGDTHDTIGLLALDSHGEIAAGCSTSGMAYKEPGRVGDSPIVGAGLFADSVGGAAAATGNGDEILKFCMSFLVAEFMRNGLDPESACKAVLRRYIDQHPERASEHVSLIALSPSGAVGAASLRTEFPYAVLLDGVVELRTATGGVA
jgi:isoaspartyl peptidase/L-asparaginase-like protein (Ntn-hydrolase superfamily)